MEIYINNPRLISRGCLSISMLFGGFKHYLSYRLLLSYDFCRALSEFIFKRHNYYLYQRPYPINRRRKKLKNSKETLLHLECFLCEKTTIDITIGLKILTCNLVVIYNHLHHRYLRRIMDIIHAII